nr:o-succinylbenzoate synthase [uncultured Muribaculum sp.]
MVKAEYCRYNLVFREPAVTSRAVMTHKETYFIRIWDEGRPNVCGIGECALFRGLGVDDVPEYEEWLREVCADISCNGLTSIISVNSSSIRFGVESALADLRNGGRRILWPGPWTAGEEAIPINGLVWMGSHDRMLERIDEKIAAGFRCIKLKIGGIDFAEEIDLLRHIRDRYASDRLELRLDANGAFSPKNAMEYLAELSAFGIHSIEQPIRAGQPEAMTEICRKSPIPIALDEELIGCRSTHEKASLLDLIHPQYVILKPSLCGGFADAAEWSILASERGIGWWATSALESDIGLNAIAQWCANMRTTIPQGLGTGRLYVNNIPSPLRQVGDGLRYDPRDGWEIPDFDWKNPEKYDADY